MTKLDITNQLKGDLGELYFKHLCYLRGYAFIKLEDIYHTFSPKGILEFKYGYERVPIEIPEKITDEVRRLCRPLYYDGSPSFVFDFFTCRLGRYYDIEETNYYRPRSFTWVEIKTGSSQLSKRQEETSDSCKVDFSIFRIRNVEVPPSEIDIEWER